MSAFKYRMILALIFTASLAWEVNATTQYSTGFESPDFTPGVFAGENMYSGQDGWLITSDLDHEPNLAAIQVQDRVFYDGEQAVAFDASAQDFDYGHLRRNIIFDPMPDEPILEIDLDLYITDSANPSEVWGLDSQSGLFTRITKWLVWNDNSVRVLSSDGEWSYADYTFTRNQWHRSKTVVDFNTFSVSLYMDDQLIWSGATCDQDPEHAFTSIYMGAPGDDTLYFDNFGISSSSEQGISDEQKEPENFGLSRNYPNPFNAQTTIEFNIETQSYVNLAIYDIEGRLVSVLGDQLFEAGRHSVIWDASGCPSGLYFARLNGDSRTAIKLVLMK